MISEIYFRCHLMQLSGPENLIPEYFRRQTFPLGSASVLHFWVFSIFAYSQMYFTDVQLIFYVPFYTGNQ